MSFSRSNVKSDSISTPITPELEGSVYCNIYGCYEDLEDYDIFVIEAVNVTCVLPLPSEFE